jgi:hypothetical protein
LISTNAGSAFETIASRIPSLGSERSSEPASMPSITTFKERDEPARSASDVASTVASEPTTSPIGPSNEDRGG